METVTNNTAATRLDIPRVARRLGTSVRHIRRLVIEKRIPYLKVGHLVRFDPSEIEQWIDNSRCVSAHEVIRSS